MKITVEFRSSNAALGGELYPQNKLKQLVKYLERRNISVYGTTGKPTFIGFDDGTGQMLLPRNPTVLQVKHELSHFIDFKNLGFNDYNALGRLGREESVLNRLQQNRSWNTFNESERNFSNEYVNKLKDNTRYTI